MNGTTGKGLGAGGPQWRRFADIRERMKLSDSPIGGDSAESDVPAATADAIDDAENEAWAALTSAGAGKRGGKSEILWWVFRNMSVPPGKIDPLTIPDQGAPAFLRDVRGTAQSRWQFLEKIFPWPSKLAVEREGGAWDDGRQTIELLDAMDKALAEVA